MHQVEQPRFCLREEYRAAEKIKHRRHEKNQKAVKQGIERIATGEKVIQVEQLQANEARQQREA